MSTAIEATGFAAMSAGAPLERHSYLLAGPTATEVAIRVTHCGVCYTDIDLIDNAKGMSSYPLVAGHEIVGVVDQVGDEVVGIATGARVGVGWYRGACYACPSCAAGDIHICPSRQRTCVGRHGGFATHVVVDSRAAFPIPDSLSNEEAAPLLCAGATVFAPLLRWLQPSQSVGVVGVGGLGHLAIQFAAAMGAEVTAISSSPHKRQQAESFGARHFIAGADEIAANPSSIDVLLYTATHAGDLRPYLAMLKPRGVLCMVSLAHKELVVPTVELIKDLRVLAGSNTASANEIREMLEFAARNDIRPAIELFDFDDINRAVDRTRAGETRFRAVLHW